MSSLKPPGLGHAALTVGVRASALRVSARDGDIGAIFGLGFPPFRGGPFRFVDAVGADEIVRRLESYERRFGARFTPAAKLVEMAKTNARFHP